MYFEESFKRGKIAEESFATIARQREWTVIPSSHLENRTEHWDFSIYNNYEEYKVDVKSMKKIQRTDNLPQDSLIWIELHGTSKANPGWLYGSKTHLLAFETCNSFLLVERTKIIELVAKYVYKVAVKKAQDAKYKHYSRGAYDILTLVEISKLRKIAYDEWTKPNYMISSNSSTCAHIRNSLHPRDLQEMADLKKEVKSIRILGKRLREISENIIDYVYCPLCSMKFTDEGN
jgi:hypothetical protein